MTLFFLSTIKGSRFITILENIITLVLVASLVIFVVFGLPKVDFANTFSSADGGFFHGGFAVAATHAVDFEDLHATLLAVFPHIDFHFQWEHHQE